MYSGVLGIDISGVTLRRFVLMGGTADVGSLRPPSIETPRPFTSACDLLGGDIWPWSAHVVGNDSCATLFILTPCAWRCGDDALVRIDGECLLDPLHAGLAGLGKDASAS